MIWSTHGLIPKGKLLQGYPEYRITHLWRRGTWGDSLKDTPQRNNHSLGREGRQWGHSTPGNFLGWHPNSKRTVFNHSLTALRKNTQRVSPVGALVPVLDISCGHICTWSRASPSWSALLSEVPRCLLILGSHLSYFSIQEANVPQGLHGGWHPTEARTWWQPWWGTGGVKDMKKPVVPALKAPNLMGQVHLHRFPDQQVPMDPIYVD